MNNATFLSLPAQDAILGQLKEVYANQPQQLDIINRWSDFTVDAPNSQLLLASRAMSTDGLIGMYSGQVTFPYRKRPLNTLVPYPLIYPWDWHSTWTLFATYMQETYGILLEDNELSLDNNSVTGPLSGTARLDALPDATSGRITFRALPSSGRFTANSTLQIRLTAKGAPVPLQSVLHLDTGLNLTALTDHH